jgi:hypothetical protein
MVGKDAEMSVNVLVVKTLLWTIKMCSTLKHTSKRKQKEFVKKMNMIYLILQQFWVANALKLNVKKVIVSVLYGKQNVPSNVNVKIVKMEKMKI